MVFIVTTITDWVMHSNTPSYARNSSGEYSVNFCCAVINCEWGHSSSISLCVECAKQMYQLVLQLIMMCLQRWLGKSYLQQECFKTNITYQFVYTQLCLCLMAVWEHNITYASRLDLMRPWDSPVHLARASIINHRVNRARLVVFSSHVNSSPAEY